MENDVEWKYDEILKCYYSGDIYLLEKDDSVSFEDMSELNFYGWDTEGWMKLAGGRELLYGYYSEDTLEAEFVHIKDGKCIRDYRAYDGEVETDEGDIPEFADWVSVSSYIDANML